jgi:hypothetical protein
MGDPVHSLQRQIDAIEAMFKQQKLAVLRKPERFFSPFQKTPEAKFSSVDSERSTAIAAWEVRLAEKKTVLREVKNNVLLDKLIGDQCRKEVDECKAAIASMQNGGPVVGTYIDRYWQGILDAQDKADGDYY